MLKHLQNVAFYVIISDATTLKHISKNCSENSVQEHDMSSMDHTQNVFRVKIGRRILMPKQLAMGLYRERVGKYN
jgi:hypothetical protein